MDTFYAQGYKAYRAGIAWGAPDELNHSEVIEWEGGWTDALIDDNLEMMRAGKLDEPTKQVVEERSC